MFIESKLTVALLGWCAIKVYSILEDVLYP